MDSGRHVVSSVVPAITVYSVVWGFFENIDFRSVRCLLCGRHLLKKGCGSTTPINLWRHLSSKHPKVYSELVSTQQHPPTSLNSSQDSNTNPETDEAFWGTEKSDAPGKLLDRHIKVSHLHKQEITPCLSSSSVSVEEAKVSSVFCNQDKNRGMKTLYQGLVLQCDIDRRSPLKCGKHGSANLHRHMSKRHPNLLSELVSNGLHLPQPLKRHLSPVFWVPTALEAVMSLNLSPSPLAGALKMSEGERRTLKREIELIEALRRTQKEEARTLEHQRELLEKLRAASARETAAEREQIESLRKAQQEEAKDLSRQREELQKEKEELQKKWDELQQEREELLLFSRGQQVS
uniref:BED-type domain-containing protein n=1 Tax=Oreochromis niloticus TaxID=8128 RepID=A0A669BGI2_ORENI